MGKAVYNNNVFLSIINYQEKNMKKWLFILMTAFLLTGCVEKNNDTTPSTQTIKEEPAHNYFCDKFMLTVDDKQIDLTTIDSKLSSVSELYPITEEHLYILGRIDENYNALMIYDFTTEEIIFSEHGNTMCWVQNKIDTVRYLKDNIVYDLKGNVIYQPEEAKRIDMIEYVVEDFKITVTDMNFENAEEIWIK